MHNKILSRLVFCFTVILFGCTKDNTTSNQKIALMKANEFAQKNAGGATQISGIGSYAESGDCDPSIIGVTYIVKLTGDLEGCLYAFVDEYECSPSGT